MPETPMIVCDNLVKIYQIANLEVVALQGLDLVISDGELVGVVGASGSGKSTLLNILGGLDRPSAGRIWVGGQDLLKLSDRGLKRYRLTRVGFVWQQGARNLVPYLTAQENVELPLIMAGAFGVDRKQRSAELLDAVELSPRKGHRLTELSGGEQQRVAIAVALANHPKILLADEPTGELDTTTAGKIYQLIKDLNYKLKVTALIVSHDPGIAHHVERVVSIRDGKLSSETVRSNGNQAKQTESLETVPENLGETVPIFEELTVLDSAGRLQIPKAFLEKHQIKGRVRVELTQEGILLLPANHHEQGPAVEVLAEEFTQAHRNSGWRGFVNRFQNMIESRHKND